MHTNEDWMRAICEQPDDDTLRLVYADWLDEQGEHDRAEFVRLQCRINYLDMGDRHLPMGVGREALFNRESELLADNWVYWGEPASIVIGWAEPPHRCPYFRLSEGCGIQFKRGFVNRIELTSDAFMQHAETLFRHPITEVRLTDCYPHSSDDFEPGDNVVWQRLSVTQKNWPDIWRERRYGVPDPIWELLPKRRWEDSDSLFDDCKFNTFPPDVTTALQWLSDACVEYGRRKVGLPSLLVEHRLQEDHNAH